MHGYSQFPWHTDGAVARRPPRYVILHSPVANRTPTQVVDLSQQIGAQGALRSLVLLARWAGEVRYVSAFERLGRTQLYRWDPDKLEFTHPSELTLDWVEDVSYQWEEGGTLVLDNWRCAHRRKAVDGSDRSRRLWRKYLYVEVSNV